MSKTNEEFGKRIAKELTKEITKQLKKNIDEFNKEEDFLKRKEENDRYFFS